MQGQKVPLAGETVRGGTRPVSRRDRELTLFVASKTLSLAANSVAITTGHHLKIKEAHLAPFKRDNHGLAQSNPSGTSSGCVDSYLRNSANDRITPTPIKNAANPAHASQLFLFTGAIAACLRRAGCSQQS